MGSVSVFNFFSNGVMIACLREEGKTPDCKEVLTIFSTSDDRQWNTLLKDFSEFLLL